MAFGPITPTKADWGAISTHLSDQILAHDAAWDSLCAKEPVK